MKHLLFLFSILVLTLSCSDDTVLKESEKVILEVNVFYTTKENLNVQIPDAQSKVFIYYGYYSADFANFSYQEAGRLKKWDDSIVLPDQSATIEANGKAIIQLEQTDKRFTILIESNYYKRITLNSYSEMVYSYLDSQENIVFTIVSNP